MPEPEYQRLLRPSLRTRTARTFSPSRRRCGVRSYANGEQAEALQVFHHAAAGFEAVQAGIGTGFGGHAAVFVDDLDARQIVTLAGFEIVRVDRKSTRLNSSHLGISYG